MRPAPEIPLVPNAVAAADPLRADPAPACSVGPEAAECRRLERELQHERLRTRMLIDRSRDGIAVFDSDYRIIEANPRLAEMLGRPLVELLSLHAWDIDARHGEAEVRTAFADLALVDRIFETRYRRQDGSECEVEVSASGVQFEGRALLYTVSRDIGARKRAERALLAREAEVRLLLDSTAEAIYGIDADGRCIFVNRALVEMLGYANADELLGRELRTLLKQAAGDAPTLAATTLPPAPAFRHGQSLHLDEATLWRRDGTPLSVEFWSQPICRDGAVIGTVATFIDIGHRRRAETALQQAMQYLRDSESRFATIFETSPIGICICDNADDSVVELNGAYEQMLGYTRGELVGRRALDFGIWCAPLTRATAIAEMRRKGAAVSFEARFRCKSGSRRDFLVSVGPITLDRREHLVFMMTDITERKQIELELAQHRRHLEELVAAKTAALSVAKEAAEAASRAKSQFVANMSHEIRTPLMAILGLAEIGARSSADPERAREAFAGIGASGRLLLGIVNDILDFSKIEAGKLKIESVPVDLRRVVGESVDLMRQPAADKGLELQLAIAPEIPASCLADPLRLGQVLLNLLSNAIKFTASGSIRVAVECRADRLLLSVADSGVGMDAEQCRRIFKAFEQADGSTTRQYGGTGLGLAITRRIVALMGGDIEVESQPGQGSCFRVRLPLRAVEVAAPPAPALPAAATPLPLAGLTILVAEDNLVNQAVIAEFLALSGARAEIAGNGREAVERVRRGGAGAYDAVLMDIQMPIMSGHEAALEIREFAPDLPIIGQTGHAFADERQRCLASGMVDHIGKPMRIDELVAIIRKHTRAGSDNVS